MGLLQALGQGQPVSQTNNAFMQYEQFNQQSQLRGMQMQKEKLALEQAQKEQEYLDQDTDFKLTPLYLSLPDEAKPIAEKMYQGAGAVDKNFIGKRRAMYRVAADIQKSKEQFETLMAPVTAAKHESAVKAYEKWVKSGDPKDEEAYKIARAEAEGSKGAYFKHLDDLEKEKVKGDISLERETVKGDIAAERDDTKNQLTEDRLDETARANQAREDATNRRLDIMERDSATKAILAESKGKDLSFADKEALRSMGKQLPKSKTLAETAEKNILKIDRMIGLVERGAGGVSGDILAKINKVADIFRRTSPDDAKYNTLKSEMRGLAGSLRLQLGLIGQTSDRDVEIMYEAAGGATPAETQKALLIGYKQGFMQDITNYNSDVEAYAGYSEAGKNLYRPIAVKPPENIYVVETRKTKDGRTLEKLSNGVIREAK